MTAAHIGTSGAGASVRRFGAVVPSSFRAQRRNVLGDPLALGG
jgi:hypothetical protein